MNVLEQIAGSNQIPTIEPKNDRHAGRSLHETSEYAENPHKAIMDFAAPFLESVQVASSKLLIATYRQKQRTKGGIILTNNYLAEDMYQGIVGVVLKLGADAFVDDARVKFGGFKAKVGDWVVYKPDEGRSTELRGLHCRFIPDICIDGVIDDPELLW